MRRTEYGRILIHAPFGGKEGRLGSWKALVEAQKAGSVRPIGVSNFGIHHLKELEEFIESGGRGRIEVGQYEFHPWLGRAELVNWLRSRGTVLEAYSPPCKRNSYERTGVEKVEYKTSEKSSSDSDTLEYSKGEKKTFCFGYQNHFSGNNSDFYIYAGVCTIAQVCYTRAHS